MTYTTASGMRSRMKSVKSMEKAATNIELPLGGAMLRSLWTIAREASLLAVFGHDGQHGNLRAGGPMDDRLDAGRLRRGRLGQQGLVVGATQRPVEAHHALDAYHPWDLLDPLTEVVEGAHPIPGERAAARVANDDAEKRLALPRKLLQLVIATPGLGVRRQHANVAIGDANL